MSMKPQSSRCEEGQKVRQLLVSISKAFQKTQAQFAELLVECHDKGYWTFDYPNFGEYVDGELGIKLRKAQELMKLWRICVEFNISPETINELGWSKLAIVGSSINKQNVNDVLKNVAEKTFAELQSEKKLQKKQSCAANKKKADSKLVVTDVIERALRLAATHARNLDTQACLESIAEHYLENQTFRPRPSRRYELN